MAERWQVWSYDARNHAWLVVEEGTESRVRASVEQRIRTADRLGLHGITYVPLPAREQPGPEHVPVDPGPQPVETLPSPPPTLHLNVTPPKEAPGPALDRFAPGAFADSVGRTIPMRFSDGTARFVRIEAADVAEDGASATLRLTPTAGPDEGE